MYFVVMQVKLFTFAHLFARQTQPIEFVPLILWIDFAAHASIKLQLRHKARIGLHKATLGTHQLKRRLILQIVLFHNESDDDGRTATNAKITEMTAKLGEEMKLDISR